VKSRNSSQCNETLLAMTVRPGKKFGFHILLLGIWTMTMMTMTMIRWWLWCIAV